MTQPHTDPSCGLTPAEALTGRISPLFWRHGEAPEALRERLAAMRSVGIRQCIVASGSHPDWLGPGWWADLDAILDEAEALGMRVWLFDDAAFPSGSAGTLIRERHPDLRKVYLACRHLEAVGPLPSAVFRVGALIAEEEALVGVVAARRRDPRDSSLQPGSLVDLSHAVDGGLLRGDLPEGSWRLFILVRTRGGGEERSRDHLNPLENNAGQAFVNSVHAAYWARYARRFGAVIAGFFTDAPRLDVAVSRAAASGGEETAIPWCGDLLPELDAAWGGPFRAALPALWHETEGLSHRARFLYMDTVSRRLGRNLSGAVGDWCRAHGVRSMGRTAAADGERAHRGLGTDHFFRALQGQDMSGLDFMHAPWPGLPQGEAAPRCLDSSRGDVCKLGSSAAHLDPRKAGNAMCELFRNNGGRPGLGGMKWITDYACVRGINFLAPHAGSPRRVDPDSPPRVSARDADPRWRLSRHWAGYAERLCHLLSGGEHRAPAAVLYNVEAEWSGDCQPFTEPVRALAEAQIDCDVVCGDTLLDPLLTRIGSGLFTVNRETFHCLVVPSARRLPLRVLSFLARMQRAGVVVAFVGEAPTGACDGEPAPGSLALLRSHPMACVASREGLAGALRSRGLPGPRAVPAQPHLRTYRYRRRGMDLLFCRNEDPRANVDTRLFVDDPRAPVGYDALADAVVPLRAQRDGEEAVVALRLEPWQSLFIAFPDEPSALPPAARPLPFIGDLETLLGIEGPWRTSPTESAGSATYEAECVLAAPGDFLWLDLGAVEESSEAWMDGNALGACICPPHRYPLGRPAAGAHVLRVRVTASPSRRRGAPPIDGAMARGPAGLLGPVRVMRMRRL